MTCVVAAALSVCAFAATAGAGSASAAPYLKVWGPLTASYVKGGTQPIYIYAKADTGQVGLSVTVSVDGSIIKQYGCGECTTLGQLPGKDPEGGDPPPAATYDTGTPTEGPTHTLKVDLTTGPPTVVTTQAFSFQIDRTPPGLASNFRARFDPSTSQANVVWDDAVDPSAPDGSFGSGATQYQYRVARGAGAFSAWAVTDYAGVVLNNSFNGESLSFEVRAVDLAGNVGASATATVTAQTPPSDTVAPTLSLASIDAGYGSADNQTLALWSPAIDPDLSDGSPSAGVSGYNVRYRLDSGAWSAWSAIPSPRLLISGGHAGQVISVEVSAFDAAGNTSAVQAATVTSAAFTGAAGELACWPGDDGIPPDCNDPADMNEPDGGPAATLSAQPSSSTASSSASPATSTNLARYYIRVGHLWTTARIRPGSYVVGNVKDGWTLDRVGPLSSSGFWVFGTIRGAFQGCGWIETRFAPGGPYANNGTSNCENLDDTGRPKLATIAQSVNPIRADGSEIKLRTDQLNGVKFCAYLDPWPGVTNQRHDCGGVHKTVTYSQLHNGYTVYWRYVTLDNKWVLVRDPHIASYATINWWFVRRSAFNVVCNHPRFTDSPGGPPCAPTN
jgi:hypothetical protein